MLHTNVDGVIRITRSRSRTSATAATSSSPARPRGAQAYQTPRLRRGQVRAAQASSYGLREDLLGRPIRITIVDPGLAQTESRSSASRGRGGGEGAVRGSSRDGGRRRRARAVRAHTAAAREHRRDGDQGSRAVERRPDPRREGLTRCSRSSRGSTFRLRDDRGDIAAETSGFFADDTRFFSRLVLRCRRLDPDFSSPRGESSTSGRCLPPEWHGHRPASRRSVDLARALHRDRDAGADHAAQREPPGARARRGARGRGRLRGHHLGEAPRLLAR